MDDKHYVPGGWYLIDDRTGFKRRNSRIKKEWTGLYVDQSVFELRQPQDFVKGVIDYQAVPYARPRPANVFIGFLTTQTTANAALGATSLSVKSTTQMQSGDTVQIMLDSGEFYKTTINGAPGSNTITLLNGLPSAASSGALVEDLTQVAQANIG